MIWENTKSSLNLGKRLDFSFRGIIWCIFTLMELFFHKRYWGGWFSHTHYQGVIEVQTEITGLQIKALFTGLDPLPLMGLLL